MIFTNKRIPKLENIPKLEVHNNEVEWVKNFNYLGLKIDAPTLTWSPHIKDLCSEGLKRLNVLRAVAGSSWGASREILLRLHTQYIRSKITYGSAAFSSASKTNIGKLETIQNAALRVALGARKTSPVKALQVDANIPPLSEYIKELSCRYYLRIKEQQDTHPMMHKLIEDPSVNNRIWTETVIKKPLVKRAEDTMRWWGLDKNVNTTTTKFFKKPPWISKKIQLHPNLIKVVTKEDSEEELRAIALETIKTRYSNHLCIYTDGSKFKDATSAAMVIPGIPHEESWRLDYGETRSIMMAEMYAIMKSMTWLAINSPLLDSNEAVILTDSRSGIEALNSPNPGNQSSLSNTIINIAETLADHISITIQWLPAHVGIDGNERADKLAKEANQKQILTSYPLERKEVKRLLNKAMKENWQRIYDTSKHRLHIGQIKPKIENWAWVLLGARSLETVMTRLRIGHVELNVHLHRFKMKDDPNCQHCNTPETVSHYILYCRRYCIQRQRLKQELRIAGVHALELEILLGGGSFTLKKQKAVTKAVASFIKETGRFSHA